MTEWTQNRAFHGVLVGSDLPNHIHSAGFQEQVYGSAAPVVLDSAIHDQFLVSFTGTDFSDWQCQEDCFLGSLLMIGGWEKILNLGRETEGTACAM